MENKVIFESEEECKKFLNKFYCACTDRERGIETTFDNIKRAGLAGKSAVEEAEEMYKNISQNTHSSSEVISIYWGLIEIQNKAIQYLKARQK